MYDCLEKFVVIRAQRRAVDAKKPTLQKGLEERRLERYSQTKRNASFGGRRIPSGILKEAGGG